MKHISTFESYNQEGRSTTITTDYAIKYIKTHCKEYLTKPIELWRGDKQDFKCALINPKHQKRMVHGFHNIVVNNDPDWKEFPKREIMFTNTYATAAAYGRPYYLIPSDNANFGICPTSDFWYSCNSGFRALGMSKIPAYYKDLDATNDYLSKIFKLFIKNYNEPTTLSQFKKLCQFAQNNINKLLLPSDMKNDVTILSTELFHEFLVHAAKNGLYESYKKLIDPNLNKFKVGAYPELQKLSHETSKPREFWTDSPCIIINEDVFADIKKSLK